MHEQDELNLHFVHFPRQFLLDVDQIMNSSLDSFMHRCVRDCCQIVGRYTGETALYHI